MGPHHGCVKLGWDIGVLANRATLVVAPSTQKMDLSNPKEGGRPHDGANVDVSREVQANDLDFVGDGSRIEVLDGFGLQVGQVVTNVESLALRKGRT